MRQYIDMIAPLIESILAELEEVPLPDNSSKEIGAAGKSVKNDMTDMLPHRGVFERNKPQSYAEVFSQTAGKTFETGFEREAPPESRTLEKRRNNDAGIDKLTRVSDKGDNTAILHDDFANAKPNTRSIVPRTGRIGPQ